jgi:mannose-6-phosphate isomerase-like protein (cupin superfamily)
MEPINVPGLRRTRHHRIEECFYILEGELEVFAFEPTQRTTDSWSHWQAADGRRPVRAGVGTCIFAPPGCPHAFRNTTEAPARVIYAASPLPDHELYLKELSEMFASQDDVDQDTIIGCVRPMTPTS